MPYQTNIPNASQSPGLFPSQAQENFTRLKTLVAANHKFNDSTATDDGYHQLVKILPTASADVPNDATVGQLFSNTSVTDFPLSYKDAGNNLFQITPMIPVRAAINFSGTGSSGALNAGGNTVRYSYNVNTATSTKDGTGLYTIRFTTALSNNNYIVLITGRRNISNAVAFGNVLCSPTYGNSVSTTFVKIEFTNEDGSSRDVDMGNVYIIGG